MLHNFLPINRSHCKKIELVSKGYLQIRATQSFMPRDGQKSAKTAKKKTDCYKVCFVIRICLFC